MLEKLGCGFYISDQCLPAPMKIFSFDGWELTDQPLVKDRYVFNWHNFLSGCNSWNTEQWLQWVDRSQKMGYNAVMVHAYFNNPMHTYSFKGIEKEYGYYTTSAIGREWGNIPVNDVRRLPGGEVFESAVIGSEAAMLDDSPNAKALQDVNSIQKMMRETFSYAVDRGVDVCFAFDMDVSLQFLQESFVSQIAEPDKFAVCSGSTWIPKPWTDEGMAFYKAQIDGLLSSYPMLTQIACWRRGGSWFANVSPGELPEEWKKHYDDYLTNNEVLKTINKKELMSSFITSRLTLAYQQVLKDMGRGDIKVSTGTWRSDFIIPTAIFLPEDMKLMPIDWNVRFNKSLISDQGILASFQEYAKGRVIPFLWSHHDDGQYIGRCYKPANKLYSKLNKANASGLGVFHWMNRPQDIYFKSLQRQVWAQTVDEPCQDTCNKMAQDYWGNKELGSYIMDWLTDAPIFGRATQPNMHYRPWEECKFPTGTRANAVKRLGYLNSVDTTAMTDIQKDRLEYFKLLETFIMKFVGTQRHLDNAEKFLTEGKLAQAQDELREGNPEQAVKTYAKLSTTTNEDHCEMAYVVSLATKWIGDYDSFRQRARLIPIRVKLGQTVPEDIAQGRVNLWYYIDKNGKFWEKLGNEILMKSVRYSNVTASSADAPAEDALDGVADTRWASRGSQWIQVDIGRIKAVDAVLIDFYEGHTRSYKLNIQLSANGKNWRTVFDGSSSPSDSGSQKFGFEEIKARYVRIHGNGNSVNEFNAYSEIYIDTHALLNNATTADANISSVGSVNERGSKYAIVNRKATGKETFIEDVFLEGIELGRARIQIRPIMRGVGVENSSHVSKGKYLLKIFASSEKGGSFSIEVGGTSKSFAVKGDKVLEFDLELKEDSTLQANAAIIDGKVVLCGLILEPVDIKLNATSTTVKAEGDSGDAGIRITDDASSNAVQNSTAVWKDSETFLNAINLIESGQQEEAAQ